MYLSSLLAINRVPNLVGDCIMDEEDFSPDVPAFKDNPDTMSAMDREAFANSMRDEWEQDS